MSLSPDSTLTATALFERHSKRLEGWGIAGQDRYNRALARFIALNLSAIQRTAMREMLLASLYNRAIAGRDEVLAAMPDEMTEDDQRATFDKIMKYQSIADRAKEALNDGN